ncbi:hypothetical protein PAPPERLAPAPP_05190 [Brevundimonas phage vB_BpoS-Papperlapapp]|uniref:Uncharacterized protein n=1 Tax=Brevundimonas phage vB_BpoS-Domovoi TaxID=2948598 RepID=A0A9E7MRQ3_9CAUD|nr:hypothetical protein DOMOVOI_04130 [Brevundimonas phage vB_BpoS-Domovoi]USN16257.1 hypothetical protein PAPPERLAPAPP_05190 [Brevundimonas phage vB_BpoS-Papperlapapp]
MLHSVHGTVPKLKRWCGPSAISIITGQPYHHALALLKDVKAARRTYRVTKAPIVKGASSPSVRAVLKSLGYLTTQRVTPAGITVAAWLAARPPADQFTTFLIVAANHWMVVRGDEACCGILGTPTPVERMKFRRGVVTECWVVTPSSQGVAPIVTEARKPSARAASSWDRSEARDRRAFVKLARQHAFTYDIVRDCDTIRYMEIAPCAVFPKGLDTLHHDWAETLDRVRHCLDHPEDAASGSYGR